MAPPLPHKLEAIQEIKKLYPRVKVIFLTMHRSKEFLQQALEAGAEGFLLKEDADFELLRTIQTVRGEGNSSHPSCPPRWRIWPCGTKSKATLEERNLLGVKLVEKGPQKHYRLRWLRLSHNPG